MVHCLKKRAPNKGKASPKKGFPETLGHDCTQSLSPMRDGASLINRQLGGIDDNPLSSMTHSNRIIADEV